MDGLIKDVLNDQLIERFDGGIRLKTTTGFITVHFRITTALPACGTHSPPHRSTSVPGKMPPARPSRAGVWSDAFSPVCAGMDGTPVLLAAGGTWTPVSARRPAAFWGNGG